MNDRPLVRKNGSVMAATLVKSPNLQLSAGKKPVAQAVGQVIDVPYALWLATLASALMATIALAVVGAVYLLDAALTIEGGMPLFGSDTYVRVLELSSMFAAVAVVAHLLRLRLEAIRRASILVPLPYRIVVNPPGGDTFSKFECSCAVTLALDHEQPLIELKSKKDVLQEFLQNAFLVAVTDPVIRFSKQKMEQTLKIAAVHVLGPGVSGVLISEVRQRRVGTQRSVQPANTGTLEMSAALG